jgi:Ca2+-binding RTX toxin-like protein
MHYTSTSTLAQLIGDAIVPSEIRNLGGVYTAYVDRFDPYADQHWSQTGADWATSTYYDRAKIYYAWWVGTGDAEYLSRANALALDYRTDYLEANKYGASAHWSQIGGVAMHAVITGDAASLRAVGAVADTFTAPYYLDNLGRTDAAAAMDNRVQARVLESFLYAQELSAPSQAQPGRDWGALLHKSLDAILATQSADGAYRFMQPLQQGYNKPFMVGLLNDALIRYYETFDADPRIPVAIRKSIDYMWANDWVASARAFKYLEGTVAGEGDATPAPDLNNLIVNGFGFIYKLTGDATYRERGDAVFAGGVDNAWLTGSKQFNQEYTSSYKYLAYTHPEMASVWAQTTPATPPPVVADPVTVITGTAGADQLQGGSGLDSISGEAGNDLLTGLGGADTLMGGAGNDTLAGGAGADLLDGGDGFDTADYSVAPGAVTVRLDQPAANTGEAAGDRFVSIEGVSGSGHADQLTGDDNANSLFGAGGADTLSGNGGNDWVGGGPGNDWLSGGAGDDGLDGGDGIDTLIGGAGRNDLRGGKGADLFVFSNADDGIHVVRDFERTDQLKFVGFGFTKGADVLAAMQQVGKNVVFQSQGDSITLQSTDLSTLKALASGWLFE